MGEHLTLEDLLTSLKCCKDLGDPCKGCPNAVPGTLDEENGWYACRVDTTDEVIWHLEQILQAKRQEVTQ
jgi:hypothetical protein